MELFGNTATQLKVPLLPGDCSMGKKPSLTVPSDAVEIQFDKAAGDRLGVFLCEKEGRGVCVNHLADDSPAFLELSPGDIIEAVNGVRVRSAVQ